MVKTLLLLTLFPLYLFADVKITAEIDDTTAHVNRPLAGTITITHPTDELIDKESFVIDNEPLQVELVRQVTISPELALSIYKFFLPAKEKGLFVLPSISAKVGEKRYSASRSSYEVRGLAPAKKQAASLKITATIEGKNTLYPGEKTTFVYDITFSESTALTEETLPLLQAEGLEKIGEILIENFENRQKISQVVQALSPGTFTFGPSTIEGYPYTLKPNGERVYHEPKLSASAPALSLTVLPFPTKDQPLSFNGAIGNYSLNKRLLSSPTVRVGDTLTLALMIEGKGPLDTLLFPAIHCQPGFSGFFSFSDLPPKAKTENNTKTFTFSLRPLTDSLKEIPPIAFSSFDPETTSYITKKTQTIPIEVSLAPKPVREAPQEEEAEELEKNYPLNKIDLLNLRFGTFSSLWIIPAGIMLILFQLYLQKMLKDLPPKTPRAKELFYEALAQSSYHNLEKAFLLRLEEVPSSPLENEVRAFLAQMDQSRFSGQEKIDHDTLKKQAKNLFKKL